MSIINQFVKLDVVALWLFVISLSFVRYSCAEVFEFDIPVISDYGTQTFEIDLGSQIANIDSISIRATGVSFEGLGLVDLDGSGTDCRLASPFGKRFYLWVRTPSGYFGSFYSNHAQNGPFTVDTKITLYSVYEVPRDGKISVVIDESYDINDFWARCGMEHWDCRICDPGSSTFDSYPVLSISYQVVTPVVTHAWGEIKARYR